MVIIGRAFDIPCFRLISRQEAKVRRHVERGWQIVDHRVQHRLHAFVLERRSRQNRNKADRQAPLADQLTQLCLGRLNAVHIGFHRRIVLLNRHFQQVIAPLVGFFFQFRTDRLAHPGCTQIFALINPLFHGHEVDDAFQLVFRANRNLNRQRHSPRPFADHLDAIVEIRPGFIHLVDEHDPRNLVPVSLTPNGFGLRLNARVAVQQHHSAIKHRQRPLHFNREVHVSRGVDDVEAVFVIRRQITAINDPLPEGGRRSRGDRDPAFLLLLHPVHRCGPIMDLTDLVGFAGVVQNPLGRRGFTRVDMGNNAKVPITGQGIFACHWAASD